MKVHVVALPGDGTGPEVLAQGLRVLRAVGKATKTELEVEETGFGLSELLSDRGGKRRRPDPVRLRGLLHARDHPMPGHGQRDLRELPAGRRRSVIYDSRIRRNSAAA